MKYIRTEGTVSTRYYYDRYLEPQKIIKQAETIEELCDGLIVEQKDKPNNWFVMEVQEFINEKEHFKDWSYKAFIKTDKGLIYIAKMNDEGELELL